MMDRIALTEKHGAAASHAASLIFFLQVFEMPQETLDALKLEIAEFMMENNLGTRQVEAVLDDMHADYKASIAESMLAELEPVGTVQ